MKPLTLLLLAAVTWGAVFAINDFWFSCVVVAISIAVAPRRLLAILGLSLPMLLSLLVIHAPAGHPEIAVELGMRAAALIASLLAVSAHIKVAELAKALQRSGLSPKLTYVLGTAIHMLPMGRRYAVAYRATMRRRGKRGTIRYVVFPLVTRMLVHSAERQLPLETAGVMLPGKRTLLR